jgi:hypothetical protein
MAGPQPIALSTDNESDAEAGAAERDAWPGTDGAAAASAASDRSFELSLRLLTVVVLVALLGSTMLLAYRLIAPRLSATAGDPIHVIASRPKPAPSASSTSPATGDQVLMDPGHVFRCEEQGRVSFSDQACTGDAKTRNEGRN